MIKDEICRFNLDIYSMLFYVLFRRFSKLNVSYVYLNVVRLLIK